MDVADPRGRALVVLAHPRPGSFNHALAAAAAGVLTARGWSAGLRDLYAEGFDPVLSAAELDTTRTAVVSPDPLVAEHQALLAAADILVVVHPTWWGKPPAMMSGWIDRVLAPGVAYRLGAADAAPEPLIQLAALVVLNTSDTPAERETEVFGDPLQAIWERCVGEYLPARSFQRRTFGPVGTSTPEARAGWLRDLERLLPS